MFINRWFDWASGPRRRVLCRWPRPAGASRSGRAGAGFTLVEVIMTTAISSLLILVVGGVYIYGGRSLTALANYSELETQSRTALDRMTMEIRQALQMTAFSSNAITLLDWDSQPLQYVYDPTNLVLNRIKGTNVQVLLTGCDYLSFGIYQRNTTNGTFDQYPATTAATCKLLEIDWVCSRSILGAKVNTESVQSAKVCIRKR